MATTPPTTPPAGATGGTKGKVEALAERVKEKLGISPQLLASPVMQPLIRRFGEFLGKKYRKSIPSNDPRRSDWMEILIEGGALGTEVVAGEHSLLGRGLSNFITSFGSTFCGGEGENDNETGTSPKLTEKELELTQKILQGDNDLLIKASPIERASLLEFIQAKNEALGNSARLLREGTPKTLATPSPTEPSKSIKEYLDDFSEWTSEQMKPVRERTAQLRAKNAAIDAERAKRAAASAAAPKGWVRKLIDTVWN